MKHHKEYYDTNGRSKLFFFLNKYINNFWHNTITIFFFFFFVGGGGGGGWGGKSKIALCKTMSHDGIHDSDRTIIPLFIQLQILDKNKK